VPLLIDGNNVLHRLPEGQRSRRQVRKLALEDARRRRTRVVVVFDGPPPDGVPEKEHLGRVTIRYSPDLPADELIVRLLPASAEVRQWSVVTDDRGLATRARDRGAEVRGTREWIEAVTRPPDQDKPEEVRPEELAEWEAFFASRGRDD